MKVVGLFQDIDEYISNVAPLLVESIHGMTHDSADFVSKFLQNGQSIMDMMGATLDPIDKKSFILGGPSINTDGLWIWRSDLIYFTEKYRIFLPDEFILHIVRSDKIIKLSNDDCVKALNCYMYACENPEKNFRLPTICPDTIR